MEVVVRDGGPAAALTGKESGMSEDPVGGMVAPKEYGRLTLKAGRMYQLVREREDLWNVVVPAICAFEEMHVKEAWEYVLLNRRDIEDVAGVYERATSPEEFREGLMELKERDLAQRLGER